MGTDENPSDQDVPPEQDPFDEDPSDQPGAAARRSPGQPVESGMDTGSDDQPRGEPAGGTTEPPPRAAASPADLDRDSLAILAELATPGPQPRRAAAEDSTEAAEAVDEDAPTEAYRPERGPDRREGR